MVIYEVSTTVEKGTEGKYREWLGPHIEAILKEPGFTGARWSEMSPTEFVVHFQLDSNVSLQKYLDERAPHYRGDAAKLFGDKAKSQRRIFTLVKEY